MPRSVKIFSVRCLSAVLVLCFLWAPLPGGKNKVTGETWNVFPFMTIEEIQAVIDSASDGDTILFSSGEYDWTGAPLAERAENKGAVNIIDKSLIIKGEPGVVIRGPDSVDVSSQTPKGVNAFFVVDLDVNNDITFYRLHFDNFLRGIRTGFTSNWPVEPDISVPNVRDITISGCSFMNIHRDAVSIADLGGNAVIKNNRMIASRIGVFASWYWVEGHNRPQPEDKSIHFSGNQVNVAGMAFYGDRTTNLIIKDNTIQAESTNTVGISVTGARKGSIISGNTTNGCIYGINLYGLWSSGMEFPVENVLVENNVLIGNSRHGLILAGSAVYDNTVRRNEVHMLPGSRYGIWLESYGDLVSQNKVSGSGRNAFYMDSYYASEYGWVYCHDEILQANNVNQFSPEPDPSLPNCHFFLDALTSDNIILGSGMGKNTYIDLGTNNRITGGTPLAGGIGGLVGDAHQDRAKDKKPANKI
ncbi:MAG: right-handed parallel beta-helix repeat-containing protein [Pseudomonadota bacterium]